MTLFVFVSVDEMFCRLVKCFDVQVNYSNSFKQMMSSLATYAAMRMKLHSSTVGFELLERLDCRD